MWVAKVSWVNGACLGRWIQALLSLNAFWRVKCRECVGDSDKDGRNSFIYTLIPAVCRSTLHAVFELCSECYVCCVHKYVCTYARTHTHCLQQCGRNLVGAPRAVEALENCGLSKYVHRL